MRIKLERIEIKGYRSCVNCAFDLQNDLSVLIGPNGSGKTNILRSLTLLKELLTSRHSRGAIQSELATTLKVWLDYNGSRVIHTVTAIVDTDEHNQDRILNARESWYMKGVTGTKKRLHFPIS